MNLTKATISQLVYELKKRGARSLSGVGDWYIEYGDGKAAWDESKTKVTILVITGDQL